MRSTQSHAATMENQPERKSHPAKLSHLRIEEGEKGGHLVEHVMEHGLSYHEPVKHVFGADQGKELLAHLAKHLHIKA